jgi:N-acetylglutamate synthase-like GNAT family acetyltransferase
VKGKECLIRRSGEEDFEAVYDVINEAASAYQGVIPAERWKEPYMSRQEFRHEMEGGVVFWGCVKEGAVVGVMGIQDVRDVTLIRHAYVRTELKREGIGGELLRHILGQAVHPVLVGTWAAAVWAVRFYEKHGFRLVSPEEKDRLLDTYWSIPERQVETSVVLADEAWFARDTMGV